LEQVPLLSGALDRLTGRARTIEGGKVDIDIGAHLIGSAMIARAIRRSEPLTIIAHSTLAPLAIAIQYSTMDAAKICHLHDIPISDMIQSASGSRSTLFRKLVEVWERLVIGKSNSLTCTTLEAAKYWRARYGVRPVVVYPGCTPAGNLPKKGHYVMAITSWERTRSPFKLLEIFERVSKTCDLDLVIAGRWQDNVLREQVQERITKTGIASRIRVESDVPEERLIQLYRGARCIVYPIRSKLVMTSLEAAANGVPIVAPFGSEPWNMFEPGRHGIAVEEDSISQYCDAIIAFSNEDFLLRQSSEILRKSRDYTWEKHAERMEQIVGGLS